MKKILSLLSSFTLVLSVGSNVTSCGPNFKSTFAKYVKEKETFVFFVGAWNCSDCQKNKLELWNYLLQDQEKELKAMLKSIDQGVRWSKTGGGEARQALLGLKLYSYDQIADSSRAFKDSIVEAIANYCVKESEKIFQREFHSSIQLTRSEIGLSGLPFFVFVNRGNYEGLHKGLFTSSSKSAGTETRAEMVKSFAHAVLTNIVHRGTGAFWNPKTS